MPRARSDLDSRIVLAARTRFLGEGVDGASLRSIAQDAATNVGMIYYYFPTKDDLFLAVVESAYARMLDDMTQIFAPERPVRDRLHGAYQRIARMSDEEFDVIRIVVREAMMSSRLQKLFARFTSGHVPLLLSTLQAGILDGTLSPTVPLPALVAALASTVIFPQLGRRRLGAELPMLAPVLPGPEALADALFEIVMHGVAARPNP
jgi:AcrR family transcriptional regulator